MRITLLACSVLAISSLSAQKTALTTDDYRRAEKMLPQNTMQYIDNQIVQSGWLAPDKYWYQKLTPGGSEYQIVQIGKSASNKPAFDHAKLAEALAAFTGKKADAAKLSLKSLSLSADGKFLRFDAAGKHLQLNLTDYRVSENTAYTPSPEAKSNEVLSPDASKAAFIKDYNLWVRDTKSNTQKQLTFDGVKHYGYATDNAGWKHSDNAILRWSPDSKKIATFRQDERKAGDMYLVTTNVGHPKLEAWKYPLPGDSSIIMIERVVIDVESAKTVFLKIDPDFHRGSLSDDISSSGTFDDIDWSADAKQLAFLSTSRDHKNEKFRIANAETGDVRTVFEETVATQYESGQGAINWRWLAATNEILWYSERDNWGHIYLLDAATGAVKNQVTKGNFVVTQLLKVDEQKRIIYFLTTGSDATNPYYVHFCKASLDGKKLTDLTPDKGTHTIKLSPFGNYFTDEYSQPDVPATYSIRNLDGKLVSNLETVDISRLKATGWHGPATISVKAHDGSTDIYGQMFTPSNLDSSKKYPVIVYIYPGPQGGSVHNYAFGRATGDNAALAELGFVVVLIEGTSNPLRSKSFHDMYFPNMAENTLPDQVGGVRQLSARYGFLDTSCVGIWGHSGGGFATACAMFTYPDFFKVGISESGNHENRNYEDDWGERYIGLLTKDAKGVSNYDTQANQVYAGNLKGKLLLAHGMMDDNVPPYNTMLVIDALEKANKDYDLIVFPNARHGYGRLSSYMMRRRWDYFATNLLGASIPKEYEIKTTRDTRAGGE